MKILKPGKVMLDSDYYDYVDIALPDEDCGDDDYESNDYEGAQKAKASHFRIWKWLILVALAAMAAILLCR